MPLILVGLNHRTAPVEVRERLGIPEPKLADVTKSLRSLDGVDGAAVLSTCNRVEAIVSTRDEDVIAVIVEWLAERVEGSFDVITARAVASLTRTLKISSHLSTGKTTWALPKGRSAPAELAEARQSWQGDFQLEPSVTDAESLIVVATGVRAKT